MRCSDSPKPRPTSAMPTGRRDRGALAGAVERGRGCRARCYLEAIDRLGRTRLRPELARAHLLYGEWLRRENRTGRRARAASRRLRHVRRDGRRRVRRPGAQANCWQRARPCASAETRPAMNSHLRRSTSPDWPATGAPTRRSAPELYISARTVEWHLRKVFTKLGISSRKGLHDALPSRDRGSPREYAPEPSTTVDPTPSSALIFSSSQGCVLNTHRGETMSTQDQNEGRSVKPRYRAAQPGDGDRERTNRLTHQLRRRARTGGVGTNASGLRPHVVTVRAAEPNTASCRRRWDRPPTTTSAAASDSATRAGPAEPAIKRRRTSTLGNASL